MFTRFSTMDDAGLDPEGKLPKTEPLVKVRMADAGLDMRKEAGAILKTGGRVRHRRSGKLGTVKYAGTGGGQCIAVGFDDESVAMCEGKDLDCL